MSAPFEALERPAARLSLARRVALIGAILFAEKFLLNFFVDFEAAQAATGLAAWVRGAQHWGFRFAVTLGACLTIFAWMRGAASQPHNCLQFFTVHGLQTGTFCGLLRPILLNGVGG